MFVLGLFFAANTVSSKLPWFTGMNTKSVASGDRASSSMASERRTSRSIGGLWLIGPRWNRLRVGLLVWPSRRLAIIDRRFWRLLLVSGWLLWRPLGLSSRLVRPILQLLGRPLRLESCSRIWLIVRIESLLNTLNVRMNDLVDLWRHHGVRLVEQSDDIFAGSRGDNHILLCLRQDRDGEEGNHDRQQHALGKSDNRTHLMIEPVKLHLVDDS